MQYLGTQLVKIHKTWLIDERSECDVAERDKVAITMSHDNPWVFLLHYLKTKTESTFWNNDEESWCPTSWETPIFDIFRLTCFRPKLIFSSTQFLWEINFYINFNDKFLLLLFFKIFLYFDVGVSAPEYLYSSIFISCEKKPKRDPFIPLGNQSNTQRMASAPPRSRF